MKQIVGLAISILCIGCFSKDKSKENEKEVQDTLQTKTVNTKSVANNTVKGEGIIWGYSNEAGKEILIVNNDTIIIPSEYTNTISNEGKLIPIHFIKEKTATSEDTDRQNYYNFAASGGNLFGVDKGKVDQDQTVLVLSKGFVATHIIEPFQQIKNNEVLPEAILSKISTDKGRKIKKQKGLVDIGQNGKLYLIEFEMKSNSALVTLALITPTTIVYKDFAAEYDETSTWGVDDGGDFGMEYYKVVAVFKNQGNLEIVTDWAGTEGYSTEYLKVEGNTFKKIKEGYRYTSPL